jgi:hypothetical protein
MWKGKHFSTLTLDATGSSEMSVSPLNVDSHIPQDCNLFLLQYRITTLINSAFLNRELFQFQPLFCKD